jgi:hypothetical protein
VRLALQADVAQSYFNLRELDAELDVYNRAVALPGARIFGTRRSLRAAG